MWWVQNLTQVYGQSPEVVSTGETDQNACSSVELNPARWTLLIEMELLSRGIIVYSVRFSIDQIGTVCTHTKRPRNIQIQPLGLLCGFKILLIETWQCCKGCRSYNLLALIWSAYLSPMYLDYTQIKPWVTTETV